MTDRELLELAAKAAGVSGKWYEDWRESGYELPDGYNMPLWNPLTNDGDALRLAVKLGLTVGQYEGIYSFVGWDDFEEEEPHGNDPYAATRRAIVRAAAEIGKADPR